MASCWRLCICAPDIQARLSPPTCCSDLADSVCAEWPPGVVVGNVWVASRFWLPFGVCTSAPDIRCAPLSSLVAVL
eukprot:6426135-Alexandrium_andersonii.AAC.1